MSTELAISLIWLVVVGLFALAAKICDVVEAWFSRTGGVNDKNDN
jgi:hypothetical protein